MSPSFQGFIQREELRELMIAIINHIAAAEAVIASGGAAASSLAELEQAKQIAETIREIMAGL